MRRTRWIGWVMAMVGSVLPSLVLAEADARFVSVRNGAQALGSLGAFLDKYLGECGLLSGAECEKRAALFRQEANGKSYAIIVTEDSRTVLEMGSANLKDRTLTLNLAPFFAASNSAITHGAPTRTDGHGNPVLPLLRIPSVIPADWTAGMMARQAAGGSLRLQLVFTPLGIWTLPKKGGGTIKGVRTRFEAVLIQVGRTGEHVGLWLNKSH